jgi:hypothetical protein
MKGDLGREKGAKSELVDWQNKEKGAPPALAPDRPALHGLEAR